MFFEGEARTQSVDASEHGCAALSEGSREMEAVRDVVREWMGSYLAKPHVELPRPGAVCPFVKPAQDAGLIDIRVVPESDQDTLRVVIDEALHELEEFSSRLVSGNSRRAKGAMVLVFPDLIGNGEMIDAAHERVKGKAVAEGLMVGQFHADCDEPSARNAGFAVNRSPIPLLAIRAMTVHDILFLHGGPEWFAAYVRRFGHLYAGGHRLDPTFRKLFEDASARFGIATALTGAHD